MAERDPQRLISTLGSVVCVTLGGWFVAYAAYTIYLFHIDSLWQDQFRLYTDYLTLPFWESATMLQNGHPFFFPALVHLVDLHAFGIGSHLTLVVGLVCWAATLAVVAWVIATAADLAPAEKACSITACAVVLAWLPSWLRLSWGTGALEGYLFTAAAAFAVWGWIRAHEPGRPRGTWQAVALASALVATLTTGAGIATWPSLVLANVLLRAPLRSHLIVVGGFAVFAVAIAVSHQGGDTPISLDVLMLARVASAGLGSIAYNVAVSPGVWMRDWGAPLVGAAAVSGFAAWLVRRIVRGPALDSAAIFFACLAVLGAIVTAMPGLIRSGLFELDPTQLYHSRYVPYQVLFWVGSTFLIARWIVAQGSVARAAFPWAAAVFIFLLVPAHLYRGARLAPISDRLAAAELSIVVGVADPEIPPPYFSSAPRASGARDLFREARVAMFRDPFYPWIGRDWPGARRAAPGLPCEIQVAAVQPLEKTPAPTFKLEGSVRTLHSHEQPTRLAILDAEGRLRGLGRIRLNGAPVRESVPARHAFDAYFRASPEDGSNPRSWRFYGIRGDGVWSCTRRFGRRPGL